METISVNLWVIYGVLGMQCTSLYIFFTVNQYIDYGLITTQTQHV